VFDYLDGKGILLRVCEAFVEGLYWRDPSSINSRTSHWVGRFLEDEELRESALNVLVALAVKPQHPFNAERLDKYLRRLTLIDRDLFWTEYLRQSLDRGTPTRLLIWAEHLAIREPRA
jgi:hypothetical protein